ncbi:hypothetical protein L204_106418 [Cryptococcus depauperatus]
MGVKDLLVWVRKTYPTIIKHYPKRFKDPLFRGKRIAIDGTLLTNRYHFANQNHEDDQSVGEIIAWYQLVSDMKAQGVKPIAIWDEKGVRDWKAKEAKKRLKTRATHLARRNHELARSTRLNLLKDAIADFESLKDEEKDAVRSLWRGTRFSFTMPSSPLPGTKGTRKALTATAKVNEGGEGLSEKEERLLENITSTVDTFANLTQAYRSAYRPTSFQHKSGLLSFPSDISTTGDEQFKGMDGLEETFRQWTLLDDNGREKMGLEKWREDLERMDERLENLVPLEEFTETYRQAELTLEEGEIINSLLSPTSESSTPDLPSPAQRLEDLLNLQLTVLRTHLKALDIPSPSNHANCRELLSVMGIPILVAPAPYEAEGLASALARAGKVDYVGTEDSDVLAYRAPLLRHLSPATSVITVIDGEGLRHETKLNEQSFLDFLILLGTDASENIPKVGPITAWKLISAHGTIENILASNPNLVERLGGPKGVEEWLRTVQAARKVFTDVPMIDETWDLDGKEVDEREVERYLKEKYNIAIVDADPDADIEEQRNNTEENEDRFKEIKDKAQGEH